MKVIKSSIGNYGLCRQMISKGLSDLKVLIGKERVDSMKCILINGNETFKKLLEDEKFEGELVLYEGCSVEGFLEIEKYYSGGYIELLDENVINILLMSIYYSDKEIMNHCIKYIKSHLNDEMILKMLELCDLFKKKEIQELIVLSEKYLKENGYKYLNNGIIIKYIIYIEKLLYKLSIENVETILESKKLIIKTENWLLNILIKWYKNEESKLEEENEKKELKKEFYTLLLKFIHIDSLKIDEIEKSILNDLKMMKLDDYLIELKNKPNHIKVDLEELNDERIEEIVLIYYSNEEDLIKEEDLRILNNNETISTLLKNEDIKMKEIGILIIVESGNDYKSIYLYFYLTLIVSKKYKAKILNELMSKYERKNRNRIVKCLCYFVNEIESIRTMKHLCGKKVLFDLLNYHCYYSSDSKKLLINYINQIIDDDEDEEEEEGEEMINIIKNEEIIKELQTKEITSFSYPQSQYLFEMNEEISIKPLFDGSNCEFLANPSLPEGIVLDKENGIIHGKVKKEIEKTEYEIICKNNRSEKKFKISVEFNIKFIELNKSDGILILNNGKLITNINNCYNYCYLNIKMESGIYHIKYKFTIKINDCFANDTLVIGLSTDNTFSDINILNKSTTCNYYANSGKSKDITEYCHIGTVVASNPNFNNHRNGSIYEVIVDMNKREFSICHNNSSPVILVKDLPSPLYSYACLIGYTSLELLSISKQI